jgi:hypothetical protein
VRYRWPQRLLVDWLNLIKIRSPLLLPIFVRRVGRSSNTPLKVASGISMNTLFIFILANQKNNRLRRTTNQRTALSVSSVFLFVLVVDLPNGNDFPKPIGNTAIQYFVSMRHFRIVLCYCFNSLMTNNDNISVEARSIISHEIPDMTIAYTGH